MKKFVIVSATLLIVLLGGLFFVAKNSQREVTEGKETPSHVVMEKKNMEEEKESGMMMVGYSGKVLAGKTSPYIDFKKSDYDKALSTDKIIFLDFYANWCPICRAEAPEIKAGFESLKTDKIIGFRVNFNDSDTDTDEKMLAQKFSVPYQHTKIILRQGKEIYRSSDQWSKNDFTTEIEKSLQ